MLNNLPIGLNDDDNIKYEFMEDSNRIAEQYIHPGKELSVKGKI
jgi:hypothetical protein